MPADAFAPSPHRLEEEGAIEKLLARAWVVDDRRVHFEYRNRANRVRGGDPLTTKVVVALDDPVGAKPPRDRTHRAGVEPPQFFSPGGWRERDPVHIARWEWSTGGDRDVDVVSK